MNDQPFISDATIKRNKEEFESLLRENVKREGAKVEDLISWLENSSFFTDPASTQYHGAFKGGLCQHCLNVYHNLKKLVEEFKDKIDEQYTEENIVIVSLLHDLSKTGIYELDYKNVKVYSPNGSKHDVKGRYEWEMIPIYKTIPANERLVYGSHEMTAEYYARCFIPLTCEESSSILHHMGGMSWDSAKDDISTVYATYPIAMLLHMADMLASYLDEAV